MSSARYSVSMYETRIFSKHSWKVLQYVRRIYLIYVFTPIRPVVTTTYFSSIFHFPLLSMAWGGGAASLSTLPPRAKASF